MKRTLSLLAVAVFTAIAGLYAEELPFRWSCKENGEQLSVSVAVAPHYYLYADTLKFSASGRDGKTLKLEQSPAFAEVTDEILGKVRILPAGEWNWIFQGKVPFSVSVDFQGCRKGVGGEPSECLLPQSLVLLGTPQKTPGVSAAAPSGESELLNSFSPVRVWRGSASVEEFTAFLRGEDAKTNHASMPSGGVWLLIVLTLLGGLGLNFTPCVLPMIPVNLAIIGADGTGRATGFRRALFYGAGMALSYGTLGVIVVLGGAKFGSLNASSLFNFIIAGIFLILALAMFGVFNIDFSARMGMVNIRKIPGGKSVVALCLGAISALLAGACVAPVVIGTLLVAANLYAEGNYAGLLLPLLLGAGMALPWPIVGAGLAVLPKPGEYMNRIKYGFGLLIVLAAGYYAYIGYTLLPGKFSENRQFEMLNSALVAADAKNRPVLIDFWAGWCKNCTQMERQVLSSPEVKSELSRFELIKFQAEKPDSPAIRQLLERYGINGLPAFVILEKKAAGATTP